MKRWENNAVLFEETGDPGTCPDCGSDNVDVKLHRFERRQSITFHCRDCGRWAHFDGFVPENDRLGG